MSTEKYEGPRSKISHELSIVTECVFGYLLIYSL